MVGSPSEAKKCRCEVGDGVHGVFLLDLLVECLLVDAGLGGFECNEFDVGDRERVGREDMGSNLGGAFHGEAVDAGRDCRNRD